MNNFKKNLITTIFGLGFVFALGLAGPMTTLAVAVAPDLGTAEDFSVLAKPSMTAANPTTISGFLGLSTGLSVTGTWLPVGHTEYLGPLTLAATARADALTAYGLLAGQGSDGALGAWGGATSKLPGVYTEAADTTFTGALTLTGTYDDVWIFQIGNDMTFSGSVTMGGTAQACNVFWQVGNDATIAASSDFKGTLIAGNDITVVSAATVDGRVLATGSTGAMSGALTTDANTITGPTCNTAPILTVTKAVDNAGGGTKTASAFSLFIDGMSVTTAVASTTYAGTVTVSETPDSNYTSVIGDDCATDGTITLAENGTYTCSITNTYIPPVVASSNMGYTQRTTTTVIPAVVLPLIHLTKVPSPSTLRAGGGMVTYTEMITNPGTTTLSNITLSDDKCSPMKYVSGDINNNSQLENTEAWVYTCQVRLNKTTTNIATASGQANGLTVRDYAMATVKVANVVPGLPNTGVASEEGNTFYGVAILVAIILISAVFGISFRKKVV
jgi:uncharacterized repeat protein (TIGR01451 family)